jgi:hypothetical protein
MEIKETHNQISILESEIKEIININVGSMVENTDFYKAVYNEKKASLIQLKAELQNKKGLLIDRHLHDERIQQISEFLKGYTSLNKNILLGVYKAIIAVSQNEVIFVMSDTKLSQKEIQDNIETYKSLKRIETNTIFNFDAKRSITYHIVKHSGK